MGKLSKKRGRSRLARACSAAVLLVALCVGFIAVNNDAARSADIVRPTVGLVNEDLAAEFNGDDYTFGTSFVDRISKDSEYNWVVLSRPVAEKAFKDGSVDAVLYIPQSFTRDILTLQELTPTKATVEYKLDPRDDERADQLLESRIVGIVDGFNQSVVKMYYASLADNMAEADGQMHATLSNQEALVKALTAEVQEPFSGTIPEIESLVAGATGLKDVNAATVEANSSLTKSIVDSLTASSEALSGQLPSVEAYTTRQQEIAQINAANGNKGIAGQASTDRDFYGTQFDALRTSTLCALAGLDAADLPEPCTLPDGTIPPHLASRIAELRQATTQYATDHGQAVNNLYADLDARVQNLRAVETLLTSVTTPPTTPTTPTPAPTPTTPTTPVTPIDPAILKNLNTEILALEATRDSLQTTLPAPVLDPTLANLDTWLVDMVTRLKNTVLTEGTVSTLTVEDWSTYTQDGAGLYVDSSDELRTSITGLVDQTAKTGSEVAGSAATVPDNSGQFDALLKNASTTFGSAEGIYAGLNTLVTSGSSGLEQNQAYYANFSSVLANTRTQGVDTSRIYDFFAAPIAAKNVSPERAAVVSVTDPTSWFDPKWATIFGIGLVAGVLATLLARLFRRKKTA